MNECDKFRTQLADYAVGGLAEALRRDIQRHVRACPQCARELGALKNVERALDSAGLEQPPPYLWSAIRREIQASESARSRWRGWELFRWPRVAFGGLAATLLFVAAFWLRWRAPTALDAKAPAYVEEHNLMSWNDPLSDKASAGLLAGLDETSQRTPDATH